MPLLNRTASGLLLKKDFENSTGWTLGSGFSVVTEPTAVCFATVATWLGPTGLSSNNASEYNGTRDPQCVVQDKANWWLFVDSGNNPGPGSVFMNSSDDRGFTWTREGRPSNYNSDGLGGPLFSGTPPPDGAAWGAWWILQSDTTWYQERFTCLQNFGTTGGGDNSWIPLLPPAYSDIWTGATPTSSMTYQGKVNYGTPYWCDLAIWTNSILFYGGTVYRYLGGSPSSVATQYIGYESSSTLTGTFTRSSDPIINNAAWPYGQLAEELRVFYHPTLSVFMGVSNLIESGGNFTNSNGLTVSTSPTDWSAAKYYMYQRVGAPVDTSQFAVGMPAHLTTVNNALFHTDGYVPFVWDADPPSTDDWGFNSPGYHRGRYIRAGVLEPSPGYLKLINGTGTRSAASASCVHTNICAEYELDFSSLATASDGSFEFRSNGSVGYRLMVRAEEGSQTLRLEKLDGTTIANGTGSVTAAPNVFLRVRLEAVGTSIKAWLDGELQINATDSTYSSGTQVAFSGKQITMFVRVFHCRTSTSVTITGALPGETLNFRSPGELPIAQVEADEDGIAVLTHTHYPIYAVERDDDLGTDYVTSDNLIWGGDELEMDLGPPPVPNPSLSASGMPVFGG